MTNMLQSLMSNCIYVDIDWMRSVRIIETHWYLCLNDWGYTVLYEIYHKWNVLWLNDAVCWDITGFTLNCINCKHSVNSNQDWNVSCEIAHIRDWYINKRHCGVSWHVKYFYWLNADPLVFLEQTFMLTTGVYATMIIFLKCDVMVR